MTPAELKEHLDAGNDLVLLDVREDHELDTCKLPSPHHIPMADLPLKLSDLDPLKSKETVVYCRSGSRSHRAALFLEDAGFTNVYNLEGGILAWSDDIDPTLPKY